jgi:hypothetical protein
MEDYRVDERQGGKASIAIWQIGSRSKEPARRDNDSQPASWTVIKGDGDLRARVGQESAADRALLRSP